MPARRLFATTDDGVRLLVRHFGATAPDAPAVLLLHGFAQNERTFDAPGRSLANFLVGEGFQVFLGQLRGRHASQAGARTLPHGFADHVERDAPALVAVMEKHAPGVPHAMVGHSMGGIITASLPSIVGNRLVARVAWCAPFNFLHWLMAARLPMLAWLRAVRAGVPLPLPTQLAGPSLAFARPLLDKGVRLPLEVWLPGSMEPRLLKWALHKSFEWESWRVLADLLELGFTEGRTAGGVPVAQRVAEIQGPFLVAAASEDRLAPPASVKPMHTAAVLAQRQYVQWEGFGHLDVMLGTRAPAVVWPQLAAFLGAACGLKRV